MLFNSYVFILAFLPTSVAGFFIVGNCFGREAAICWLALMSLLFYAWWSPVYLVFIIFSMAFNFAVGRYLLRCLNRPRQLAATYALIIGITVNLAFLAYFKYANFIIGNINSLFGADFLLSTIVLPLAISFFTFQQITYLVDARKGQAEEYRFSHYSLFVTFFPQLIAGPIVHHGEVLPQFTRNSLTPVAHNIAVGLAIFSIGLVKKTILADNISVYSTPVFAAAAQGDQITFFAAWGGALAYTMQLYFDFSGYSDMAIGSARLFGIYLPLNFNSPYKATSIIEFWRRWHITLSRFLRDYLYIPLGGNKNGLFRRYFNLSVTMLLGGLWHGAGWTFVVWGGLHGLYLSINHGWRFLNTRLSARTHFQRTTKAVSWLFTFLAIVVGWVFFRSADIHAASAMLSGMFGFNGIAIPNAIMVHIGILGGGLRSLGIHAYLGGGSNFVLMYAWIILLLMIALLMPNTQEIMIRHEPTLDTYTSKPRDVILLSETFRKYMTWSYSGRWAFLTATVSAAGLLSLSQVSEFLYFQF